MSHAARLHALRAAGWELVARVPFELHARDHFVLTHRDGHRIVGCDLETILTAAETATIEPTRGTG